MGWMLAGRIIMVTGLRSDGHNNSFFNKDFIVVSLVFSMKANTLDPDSSRFVVVVILVNTQKHVRTLRRLMSN